VNEVERICEVSAELNVGLLVEVDDVGDVIIECDNSNSNSSRVNVKTFCRLSREVDDQTVFVFCTSGQVENEHDVPASWTVYITNDKY